MTNNRSGFLAGGLVVSAALLGLCFSAAASAPVGRYTLSTDTVFDNFTRLTWQRAVTSTTFTWDGSTSPISTSAQYYCNHSSLGGAAPGFWRLPRIRELESLVDFGVHGASIDVTAFPNTPLYDFWSSSPDVVNAGYAWAVDFGSGDSRGDGTTFGQHVRCVHVAYVPDLSETPDRLDFGQVRVGESKTLTFAITNNSPVPLVPDVEPGQPRGDFFSSPSGFLGALAANGGAATVTVTFAPNVVGLQGSSINVSCAICQARSLQLSGTGWADVVVVPDAGPVDAGPVDAG